MLIFKSNKTNFIQNLAIDSNLFLLIFIFLFFFGTVDLYAYETQFVGVSDKKILELIQSTSQLEKLKGNPPSTPIGLRRRAEGDITNILDALHSYAYYGAKATFDIEDQGNLVVIHIEMGPLYPLAAFDIHYTQNNSPLPQLQDAPTLDDLKVKLGEPALPGTILDAEDSLLDHLNLKGYAFATIKKREVLVNEQEKNVIVVLDVEAGSLTYFGRVRVSGHDRVVSDFFHKKLRWREGDLYDPCKVKKTQEAMELSGLFRSVNISHAEVAEEGNLVPINITVVEAKQRSIGFGVNYATDLGPGITGEWEDRNIFGNEQKLSFRTDLWYIKQEGILTYLIPDFLRPDQNLIWQIDYHHDKTKGFTDSTAALSGTLERKLSERLRVSFGGTYKHIRSEHSARNGTFDLFQVPLQLRWTNADSILEPTKGGSINLKVIPSLQFLQPQFAYFINTFTGTYYKALNPSKRNVLAAKLMLGSIVGAGKHDIPPPERFFAGSEGALRGYKYLTVSPLGEDHKPLGGRSLFIYSLELRNRIGKDFGWVAFYDIGNVFSDPYPNFKKGMLQSVGIGVRYYTPIGPLRLDVAVPLTPRKHVDGPYQFYFSIGQSF